MEPGRLRRLLGADEVERARGRLESGRPLEGRVTLRDATLSQQRAAATLLGRRVGLGDTISIRLEDVDAVVRGSGADPEGLASAVVTLTGPVSTAPGSAPRRTGRGRGSSPRSTPRSPAVRSSRTGRRGSGARGPCAG